VIVGASPDWRRLLRTAGPALALLFVYDAAISVAFTRGGITWVSVPDLPLPLLGSAIGVFVALRNNVAYARWWEARTLWGAVGNASRNLVRAAIAMVPENGGAGAIARLQVAYLIALRCALRRQDPWAEIEPLVTPVAQARVRGTANLPTQLLAEQARLIATLSPPEVSDIVRIAAFDRILGDLANAQGGLERIRNTPLPKHFDYFPRLFITAYGLLLPLGLVHDLELLTPLGSTLISAIFYALDRIGADLEAPLDNTVHDVPMSAIARGTEIDLRQMIGERDTPPPVAPERGVLW
jgi:putative membrane protein